MAKEKQYLLLALQSIPSCLRRRRCGRTSATSAQAHRHFITGVQLLSRARSTSTPSTSLVKFTLSHADLAITISHRYASPFILKALTLYLLGCRLPAIKSLDTALLLHRSPLPQEQVPLLRLHTVAPRSLPVPPDSHPIRAPAINVPTNTAAIILFPVPQPLPIPVATPSYNFQAPSKRITSVDDIGRFNESPFDRHFLGFVPSLSHSIRGRKLSDPLSIKLSPVLTTLISLLQPTGLIRHHLTTQFHVTVPQLKFLWWRIAKSGQTRPRVHLFLRSKDKFKNWRNSRLLITSPSSISRLKILTPIHAFPFWMRIT